MSIAGALWFLTAMFFASILYRLILFVNKSVVQTALVVLVVALGYVFSSIIPFRLPYALDVSLVSIGFMHIGHFMKASNDKTKSKAFSLNVWIYVVLFIAFGALSFVNSYVNLREGLYGNIILFWINASGISLCLWMLCKKILIPKILTKLANAISYAGHWSIVFLITNQMIIFLIGCAIDKIEKISAHLYLKKTVIIILTFVCIYIVTYIWNYIKYNCFRKKKVQNLKSS